MTVLALFDKPDPLDGPFFEETIYVTPSRLPTGDAGARSRRRPPRPPRRSGCARVRSTPSCGSTRTGPGSIEMAGRSIGGLCSTMLEFGAGMSLEEMILRHAVGLPIAQRSDGQRRRRDDDPHPGRRAAARRRWNRRSAGGSGCHGRRDHRATQPTDPCRYRKGRATSASSSPAATTRLRRSRYPRGAHSSADHYFSPMMRLMVV